MSRTLVNRATTDDQKAVTGLVLKELADKTLESIIECQNIQTMLLSKLAKPSPDVKLKALTCIKYLAQNGRDDFRIELQRNHTKIREHTTIRGVADPLRGELPFDKVREMAKEAMNAIFNSTGRVQDKNTANRMTGYGGDGQSFEPSGTKMQSMSSDGVGVESGGRKDHDYGNGTFSAGSMGQSGRVMQGFGNYDPNKEKTILEKMKDKVLKEEKPGPYKPYVKPAGFEFSNYGAGVDITPATADATRKKFAVGGDWGKEDAPAAGKISSAAVGATSQKFGPSAGGSVGVAQSSVPIARNKNVQPTDFERKIIEEITVPTGVRVALTAGELAGFLRKCESLDTYMVVGLLNEKLADPNPASQQKALHCLESLLSTERFAEDTEEFLSDHEETIASLLGHSNKAIRAKALKIMVQIGLREPESESSQAQYVQSLPQSQQQAQTTGPVDLLNLNNVETTTTSLQNFNFLGDSAPSTQPIPQQSAQPAGGFDFAQPTNTQVTAQKPDAFNFTQPATSDAGFNFTQPTTATQPVTQPATQPATQSNGFNFTQTQAQPNAGFNFMEPQSAPQTGGFNFTQSSATQPNVQSTPQSNAGFNFTQSAPAQANAGFNFTQSAPSQSGFNFTQPSTAASSSPSFNFEPAGSNSAPVFHFASSTNTQAPSNSAASLSFVSSANSTSTSARRDPVADLLLGSRPTSTFQQQQPQFQVFQQQYPPQQHQQYPPQQLQQQHFQQGAFQQQRNFPQLQPLESLQPTRPADNFFGAIQPQQATQKATPTVDSFAFVKDMM